MRRKADAWLNATQILKVAGFDKPQRTRVLEREVQKGTHEKVQGGYGKYQGASAIFYFVRGRNGREGLCGKVKPRERLWRKQRRTEQGESTKMKERV
jgi:hypothetical protein